MKEEVLEILHKEIELEHIPGAMISVSHRGEVILEEAIGNRVVHPHPLPMTKDTVFDLASLTKVVATLPAILKLLDQGAIRLDDPVAYFLPNFAKEDKESITIKHLLTHTSGLPAHKQYYLENLGLMGILERIYAQPLVYEPGTDVIYSDLGLITLYKIIETVTEQPFTAYLQKEFFQPLEMYHTSFIPDCEKYVYAATEYSDRLQAYKEGIVHDDNTEAMGGISGHAGLFSTVGDLQNYATMIENNGVYKRKRILSEVGLTLSKKNYTPFAREYRGLGWILQGSANSSSGDYFSDGSYGHTGFTGTSIWFDPAVDVNVILLTNRVHYGRKPPILRLRPRIHNLIRKYF